jgi:tryptophanyl-tRNA synthetase
MIEQTREIVHKFNSVYGETLVTPEMLLPENAACLRLPGTDGKAKMSKSLGNCIYLSDTSKEIKKKVNSMYTDPEHLQITDPGHVEGNVVFTYLDAFCNDEHFAKYLPEYENLEAMKDHYRRGGLGDGTCKKFLFNIMEEFLQPMRERRAIYEQNIPQVYEILKKGCEVARAEAAKTLADVRKAMQIDYFDDAELIAEHTKKYQK